MNTHPVATGNLEVLGYSDYPGANAAVNSLTQAGGAKNVDYALINSNGWPYEQIQKTNCTFTPFQAGNAGMAYCQNDTNFPELAVGTTNVSSTTSFAGMITASSTPRQSTTSSLFMAGGGTLTSGAASGTYYAANAPSGNNADLSITR